VWVVDPQTQTVSLRNVEILRHDSASVVVSQGLEIGELVVTAGVQTLHPGQKIRLLAAASSSTSTSPNGQSGTVPW
jgi:membrane fusion protein, multidrug efflux system